MRLPLRSEKVVSAFAPLHVGVETVGVSPPRCARCGGDLHGLMSSAVCRDAATCRRRWLMRLGLGRIVRKTVAGETYCWVAGQFPGGGSPSAAPDPHGHLLARALKSRSIPPASWSGWIEVTS